MPTHNFEKIAQKKLILFQFFIFHVAPPSERTVHRVNTGVGTMDGEFVYKCHIKI